MKYLFGLALLLCLKPTSLHANSMVATSMDMTKDGELAVVLGYGRESCNFYDDGITVFAAGMFVPEPIFTFCGVFDNRSAESITIINEKPLKVMVAAEGYGYVYYCDLDVEYQEGRCRKNYYSVIKHGELREISGMDISKEGYLYAVGDNATKIYKLSPGCTRQERCKIEGRIYLPKRLDQAEGLDINRCPERDRECLYVADIGRYGTGLLYTFDLTYNYWHKKPININPSGKDAEAFATYVDEDGVYAVVLHKDTEGTYETYKL